MAVLGIPVGVEIGAAYEITGPDDVRAVFNDPTDADFVGYLTALPGGIDSPEVRENADEVTEGDGGLHGDFFHGRRPLTFEGLIHPEPRAAFEEWDDELTLARTNFVTNPSFEVDTAGYVTSGVPWWLNAGATITRIGTVGAPAGAYAGYVLMPNAGSSLQGAAIPVAGPFLAGVTYVASAYVYLQAGAAGGLMFFGDVSANAASVAYTATAAWVRKSVAWTPSADVATAYLGVRNTGGVGVTATHAIDAVQVEQGSVATAYFDGTTYPAGYPQRSAWAGTAHASRSLLYNVTRTYWSAAKTANIRIDRLKRAVNAMREDGTVGWTPAGGVPVQIAVRRQQPPRVANRLPKTFQIGLVSEDHRIFSQEVHSEQVIVATSLPGGLVSPLTSPLVSTQSIGGTMTVTNDGSAPTPPVFIVYGAGVNPTIRNTTNGGVLNLAYTLSASEFLVIDAAAHTIRLNDSADRYSALIFATSDWFDLEPGDNTIQLEWASVSAGASLTVEHRDAWI